MNYLFLVTSILNLIISIFLIYRIYSKPMIKNLDIKIFKTNLPKDFKAHLSPPPEIEPNKEVPLIPPRRSSYDTPRR